MQNVIIIGGAVLAFLYFKNREKGLTGILTDIVSDTVSDTAEQVTDLFAGTPSGGSDILNSNPTPRGYTWIKSPFDAVFEAAYSSVPTYSQQHPYAPGVIDVSEV